MKPLLPLLLAVTSCAALRSEPAGQPARLLDPQLTEASGLAVSRRDPALLWVVNDSGSDATLHLTAADGSPRGSVSLKDIRNLDWEDLAAFKLDGKPYLLVADTGDNAATRSEIALHVVAEPAPPATNHPATLGVERTIRFGFEDGPRDCESVAVDAPGRRILLISKRDKVPAIYELPLAGTESIARRIGTLAPLPLPKGSLPHPFATQPTALDISADGRLAAVLTYRGVYLFRKSDKDSWASAFSRAPEVLGAHGLSQAEALAFSPDARTLYVTSEGKRPRLIALPVPAE